MSPTSRYGIEHAPDGLRLVQDVLNTIAVATGGGSDLLEKSRQPLEWLASIDRSFASRPLTKAELLRLHDLRQYLRHSILPETPRKSSVTAPLGELRLSAGAVDGKVTASPIGDRVARVVASALAERLFAERDGTWNRLKLCRNAACSVAFYDRTRNNNGVWHDVHLCGNAFNLRASRARRKSLQ